MEAILKFNLDDKDDNMAHLRCLKSLDMAIILFEIQYNLRKKVLSKSTVLDSQYIIAVDYMMDELNELMEDINIDELIN